MRIAGRVLEHRVKDPAGHLRRELSSDDGRVRGAIVLPHHLWLVNRLDADEFVGSLIAEGHVVVALARRSAVDRGLSLALCGPGSEVLPTAPRQVDPGDVALYAYESDAAVEWFDRLRPSLGARLEFEHDVAADAGRQHTVDAVAGLLHLAPWPAPPEPEMPDSETLWSLVANADSLRAQLAHPFDAYRD